MQIAPFRETLGDEHVLAARSVLGPGVTGAGSACAYYQLLFCLLQSYGSHRYKPYCLSELGILGGHPLVGSLKKVGTIDVGSKSFTL